MIAWMTWRKTMALLPLGTARAMPMPMRKTTIIAPRLATACHAEDSVWVKCWKTEANWNTFHSRSVVMQMRKPLTMVSITCSRIGRWNIRYCALVADLILSRMLFVTASRMIHRAIRSTFSRQMTRSTKFHASRITAGSYHSFVSSSRMNCTTRKRTRSPPALAADSFGPPTPPS